MNDTNLFSGFLRLGIFIGGCGFVMLFFQPPGSGAFVMSACSAGIGLVMVLGVVIVMRLTR